MLAVYDQKLLHADRVCVGLLDDDGPQEVCGIRTVTGEPVVGDPTNIRPERPPLLLLVPHVRALVNGHREMLRHPEDALRGGHIRLHGSRFLVEKPSCRSPRTFRRPQAPLMRESQALSAEPQGGVSSRPKPLRDHLGHLLAHALDLPQHAQNAALRAPMHSSSSAPVLHCHAIA